MTEERRRRLRVPVSLQAEVRVEGETVLVETLNLSLKGLLCTSAPGFSPGLRCQVRLPLGVGVSLTIKGVIVRAGDQEAAIDFDSMDEESCRHLRRLVAYNAPGTEQVMSELLAPAFPLRWQPRAAQVPCRSPAFPWERSGRKG
jgi:hypothetical protein